MALPTFRSLAARRQAKKEQRADGVTGPEDNSERTLTPTTGYVPGVNLNIATKTRRSAIITACIFFLISVVFLILVRPPIFSVCKASSNRHIDNNRQHQQTPRHPINLLPQTQPHQHNPRLSRQHPTGQLPRALSRPPRFLPSRPLELLRRLQRRRDNLLLQTNHALLVQPRRNPAQ